jgi:integrase
MKKLIQQLAERTRNGERTLPDGSYVSDRRLITIEQVAAIADEIRPGPASERHIANMVNRWRETLAPGTVKLYITVAKQATKGMEYIWPSIKTEESEPTPLPTDIAKRIVEDDIPAGLTEQYDTDCWTACKLAINSCLRPVDAISVTANCIGDGEMIVRHRKTKRQVRSSLNPNVAAWLTEREESEGDIYSREWMQLNEDYRKRLLKDFLMRLLDAYGIADRVIIGMDAGSVSKRKLRDVITAKSLRSTGANLLLSMGVPAHDVMAIGGWTTYQIFQKHYLKPNINVWN